jgi:hypothetical protein
VWSHATVDSEGTSSSPLDIPRRIPCRADEGAPGNRGGTFVHVRPARVPELFGLEPGSA